MTSKSRDWDGLISTLRRKQKPIKYEIEKHQRSQPMNIAVGPDEPEGKNQRMIHVGVGCPKVTGGQVIEKQSFKL